MAYEYEHRNIKANVYSGLATNESVEELKEVYRKAKAFDEIREFINRKLKEEEEKRPRTLLSDYDEELYKACDSVDDIIQEYVERADDER